MFKVGDKVRCVKAQPQGILVIGKIYKVIRAYEYQGERYVNLEGVFAYERSLAGMYEERFVLAENGVERAIRAMKGEK